MPRLIYSYRRVAKLSEKSEVTLNRAQYLLLRWLDITGRLPIIVHKDMGELQSSDEYFMNSNTKSMLKGSKREKTGERLNVNTQTICKNPDSIGHMQKDRGHTEIVHQSDKQN